MLSRAILGNSFRGSSVTLQPNSIGKNQIWSFTTFDKPLHSSVQVSRIPLIPSKAFSRQIKPLNLAVHLKPTNTKIMQMIKVHKRSFSTDSKSFAAEDSSWMNEERNLYQKNVRNIGISAHIDSGKTTLTERILFYTGRISAIHEVKGKDKVGATMDFMDLEREKGITIQSAATYCSWGNNRINIIDTPGHVDFTIEVERALRVLDGAILVMCGVSGVQSQTMTVDRQMRRYSVPRLVFINKLDRAGGDAFKVLAQLRAKLSLNAVLLQIPIGLENLYVGCVDLITKEAIYYEGSHGENVVRTKEIPADLQKQMNEYRAHLLGKLADVDDVILEKMMEGVEPTVTEIHQAIRRATIAHKFTPVLLGTALKNKGVQPLLDAVIQYLPNPMETTPTALDITKGEEKVKLKSDTKGPFVALAFKLEEGRFGQLTYMRVYSGKIQRGDFLTNVNTTKKIKVPRLVRMHANHMEDIQDIGAGEICAMFGVDCYSGHTFTNGTVSYVMTSMHVPNPVMSLAVAPRKKEMGSNFSKALSKFQKEDPTFNVKLDPESNQTIISGMGELHLEIYLERMKREFQVETTVGKPQVAYRETVLGKANFQYTHKKQSGGAGQYARVCGYVEGIAEEEKKDSEFLDATVGGSIPPNFMPAVMKGYEEALEKGPLAGYPVVRTRMVVDDGLAHPVDSNEIAFRTATVHGFRDAFKNARPVILEPVMTVEITAPAEFQSTVIAGINKRKGVVMNTDIIADTVVCIAEVPLNNMFGYSTDLRSSTQGKGEFVMEYTRHSPVTKELQNTLVAEFQKKYAESRK